MKKTTRPQLRLVHGGSAPAPEPEPDTLELLRALLFKAEAGDVDGLALCARLRNSPEVICTTGRYRAAPDEAVSAGLRLAFVVTRSQVQDD